LDSAYALQKAMVPWLQADAGVAALVADRVFDQVPDDNPSSVEEGWPYPCISVGECHATAAHGHGYAGAENYLTVHGWSRGAGFPEVKQIGAAIVIALDDAPLPLEGHRLVALTFETGHYLRDKDGLTSHGVFVFKALTTPI
jgi:hypothetical protein